jgi:Integrase core domain.
MGQILHNCARTTAAVRRAIQHSQESLLKLAERYDLNPKTVQKWRRRCFVEDAPMGPKEPHSTTLTREQEAIALAFRKLTRSALHRCFQRHGISRLPRLDASAPARKKFKDYPLGYFHIDLTEVRTEEGKLYLFVAVDRTSKFTFARLVAQATRRQAADFLQELIAALPYKNPHRPNR